MQLPTTKKLRQFGWLLICILVLNAVVLSKSVFPQTNTPSRITLPTQTEDRERAIDIYKRLLEKRIVFLDTQISDESATTIIAVLLYLEQKDPNQDIYLCINSPGGSVTGGMAIYDAMQSIKPDVVTISTGLSASMAAFLLASGTKGKRFAMPDSRIMIHQPLAGRPKDGENIDRSIQAREVEYFRKKLNEIFANLTGQSVERIERDTRTDFFMSATEAKEYGIIDQVISRENLDYQWLNNLYER